MFVTYVHSVLLSNACDSLLLKTRKLLTDLSSVASSVEEAKPPQNKEEYAESLRLLVDGLEKLKASCLTKEEWFKTSITSLKEAGTAQNNVILNLQKRFEELNRAYNDVRARYDKLSSPPHEYGSFVRILEFVPLRKGSDKKLPLIEVRNRSGASRCVYFFDEAVDVNTLQYAELLVISDRGDGHAIARTLEFSLRGQVGIVTEIFGTDREGPRVLVATGEMEEKILVHPRAGIAPETLKEGRRVLIDGTTHILLEVLPDEESEKFKLGTKPKKTFLMYGGYPHIKKALMDFAKEFFLYSEQTKKIGLKAVKGVLLKGPSGTGKTHLAEAFLSYLLELSEKTYGKTFNAGLFIVNGPELQDWLVGKEAFKVRNLFARAKKHDISVIVIDELDASAATRGSGISSDRNNDFVTQFTSTMEGIRDLGNIVVFGLTNRKDIIDPAVVRRFTEEFYVGTCTETDAAEIFPIYLKASWDELHPQYNVDLYPHTYAATGKQKMNKDGTPKDPETFRHDPMRVRDYLIKNALRRMFDKSEPKNCFVRVKYAGDDWTLYRYGDFVTGAMIESIIQNAKRRAFNRHKDSIEARKKAHDDGVSEDHLPSVEPQGVRTIDLYLAIEQEFERIRSPADDIAFINWFLMQGNANGRRIVGYDIVSPKEKEVIMNRDTPRGRENDLSLDSDPGDGDDDENA